MKRTNLFLLAMLSLFTISCNNSSRQGKAELKIIVDYEKQSGHGSNQYAIWIEDAEGTLVKTLFVTSFTADGGYVPRPACTPIWVKKANPDNLSIEDVDAFSGATPQSGLQTYTWDLTDNNGTPVANGTYTFVVEGTLYGDSEVIFKALVTVGGKETSIDIEPSFTSENEKNKGMIKSVKAEYTKSKTSA